MAIDFPNSPAPGASFTTNNKTWTFTDGKWALLVSTMGVAGPTGATGPIGDWSVTQLTRAITGASNSPTTSDNGKLILVNTASGAVTVTLDSAVLSLSAGQRIDFIWLGAATSVSFTVANSAVLTVAGSGYSLRARYSAATVLCVDANTYVLVGDVTI